MIFFVQKVKIDDNFAPIARHVDAPTALDPLKMDHVSITIYNLYTIYQTKILCQL